MMQVHKLYIDNLDAMTEYGVFVEKGGYKQVIQMPSFKKIDTTDWPEYDGVEADLTSPNLDTRQLQIPFCIVNKRWAEDLFIALSDGVYHDFYFREIGKTYRLRLVSNGTFSSFIKLGKLTLTFADDFPSIGKADPYELGETEVTQRGYLIEDVDLSQFGIWVLRGTDDSIRKAPNVRGNLKRGNKIMQGVVYDDEEVHFKSKDVTLKLLINAPDLTEFWYRWDAFFQWLIVGSGTKTFYFAGLESEYECFYKSNSVSRFEVLQHNGHVWCEFSVVLTFTEFAFNSSWRLLAMEFDDLVLTEDALANIKIRLS